MKLSLTLGTSLDDIKIQDLGKLLCSLEKNTGIYSIQYDINSVHILFINPNYRTDLDVAIMEIKAENNIMYHNEASFFILGYTPDYNKK